MARLLNRWRSRRIGYVLLDSGDPLDDLMLRVVDALAGR